MLHVVDHVRKHRPPHPLRRRLLPVVQGPPLPAHAPRGVVVARGVVHHHGRIVLVGVIGVVAAVGQLADLLFLLYDGVFEGYGFGCEQTIPTQIW